MLLLEENLTDVIDEGLCKGSISVGDFEKVPAQHPRNFKSFAEKRFAHCCDKQRLAYEYEPHTFIRTFRTSNNTCLCYAVGKFQYTPDFYIPSLDLYVEVKAQDTCISNSLVHKYRRFASQIMKQSQTRFAIINFGFSDERTRLEMSNFGHPDVMDIELDILNLLLEF